MFRRLRVIKKEPYIILCVLASVIHILSCSQQNGNGIGISIKQVDHHIKYLSSDELKGRDPFSEDIQKSEDYIAKQFRDAGLKCFEQFPDYRHTFDFVQKNRRNPDDPSKKYTLSNIVGYIEGSDPELKNEYIIFGAHHDHIGIMVHPRHHPNDEYETLNVENMTNVICGMTFAARSLISGEKTPRLYQPVEEVGKR
jgi:hypothetical protein